MLLGVRAAKVAVVWPVVAIVFRGWRRCLSVGEDSKLVGAWGALCSEGGRERQLLRCSFSFCRWEWWRWYNGEWVAEEWAVVVLGGGGLAMRSRSCSSSVGDSWQPAAGSPCSWCLVRPRKARLHFFLGLPSVDRRPITCLQITSYHILFTTSNFLDQVRRVAITTLTR
jgi:hypothetical protein